MRMLACFDQLLPDISFMISAWPVGRRHGMGAVAVDEGAAKTAISWHQPGQRGEFVMRQRDRAAAHAVDGLLRAAELRIGEDLDL